MVRRTCAITMALLCIGLTFAAADTSIADRSTVQLRGVVAAKTNVTIESRIIPNGDGASHVVAFLDADTNMREGCIVSFFCAADGHTADLPIVTFLDATARRQMHHSFPLTKRSSSTVMVCVSAR